MSRIGALTYAENRRTGPSPWLRRRRARRASAGRTGSSAGQRNRRTSLRPCRWRPGCWSARPCHPIRRTVTNVNAGARHVRHVVPAVNLDVQLQRRVQRRGRCVSLPAASYSGAGRIASDIVQRGDFVRRIGRPSLVDCRGPGDALGVTAMLPLPSGEKSSSKVGLAIAPSLTVPRVRLVN